MRLLVCGSRTYDDYDEMKLTLDQLTKDADVEVVINGGMCGADALSSYWAYDRKINTTCVGAKWGDEGNQAGPLRNRLMLEVYKPTLVVAFYDKPRHLSRGTRHMVEIAREAGVPVCEFDY